MLTWTRKRRRGLDFFSTLRVKSMAASMMPIAEFS